MHNWFQPISVKRLLALPALVVALCLGGQARAAGGDYPLDHFPAAKLTDQAALQNGAKLFVNYCLNCHSASLMRYNRLRDIGLTEEQIRGNLLFTADKVGETMRTAMKVQDAKDWFGALPPDLSVIARARSSNAGSGADWLYTYLRSYYRDDTKATGWNNALFPNVGMPHVLWELQGSRGATIEELRSVADPKTGKVTGATRTLVTYDAQGRRSETTEKLDSKYVHDATVVRLSAPQGGTLSQARYDEAVADLVAYIAYMSDPSARTRLRLGVWVMLFLGLFTILAWWLNREFWKDVK